MSTKIDLLCTDYDGTLSPMGVPRSRSEVAPSLASVLRDIAKRAGVAVITSKPFDFIHERIPYAVAWGCISGLDIRFSDGSAMTVTSPRDVQKAMSTARNIVPVGVAIEPKRDSSASLGFSVDWRATGSPPDVQTLISAMSGYGLVSYYDPPQPFVDFLCTPARKAGALMCIKDVFAPDGSVLYLGDSVADNTAFRAADVSVGVSHGQKLGALDCEFLTSFEDIATFLIALAEAGMRFDADLPGVRRK